MARPMILFCDNNYLALQYDPCFKSGGATKQVVAWVEGLKALGVEAKVLGAHPKPDFFRGKKQTVVSYNPNRGIPKLRYLYVRIPGILRALSNVNPDCIYYGVPSPFAGVIGLCAKLRRKRFILRVSNDIFVDGRAQKQLDPVRAFFFRLGFKLSDQILCQNSYQFERIQRDYENKAHRISNPFSGTIAGETASFESRSGVAWAGIFQEQKNLPLLAEIARALPQVPFKVAGGHDKPLSSSDRAALEELRSLPNVTLVGFLNKEGVLALMEESRLLLNTSHYEGFSNTFLEAFSRGTPVFTLPQNDPDQIIATHALGETAGDAGTLISAIREFVENGQKFSRYSTNCIGYMKQHHDLTKQAAEFLTIICGRS